MDRRDEIDGDEGSGISRRMLIGGMGAAGAIGLAGALGAPYLILLIISINRAGGKS